MSTQRERVAQIAASALDDDGYHLGVSPAQSMEYWSDDVYRIADALLPLIREAQAEALIDSRHLVIGTPGFKALTERAAAYRVGEEADHD
ncbi:MAG TPA: hypothetical protein VN039_07535 [Nitrospira sp.]|nr:hypothetical protein [Nitrospira sp.]